MNAYPRSGSKQMRMYTQQQGGGVPGQMQMGGAFYAVVYMYIHTHYIHGASDVVIKEGIYKPVSYSSRMLTYADVC